MPQEPHCLRPVGGASGGFVGFPAGLTMARRPAVCPGGLSGASPGGTQPKVVAVHFDQPVDLSEVGGQGPTGW